jgi:hypothetical protein
MDLGRKTGKRRTRERGRVFCCPGAVVYHPEHSRRLVGVRSLVHHYTHTHTHNTDTARDLGHPKEVNTRSLLFSSVLL